MLFKNKNKMEQNWEANLLTTAGGSIFTVILGLVLYCLKNKLKHSKVKSNCGCCEFSAQEDSIRKETIRLEEIVTVLQKRAQHFSSNTLNDESSSQDTILVDENRENGKEGESEIKL